MRPAALAVLVILTVAVPLAALRSEEAEDVRLALSARIVRTEAPLAFDLRLGETMLLAGEDGDRLIEELGKVVGHESVAGRGWSPAASDGGFSTTSVGRTSYIQDFEMEAPAPGEPRKPILGAIGAGVIADLDPTWSAAERTVTFRAQLTIAVIARPIATFVTRLGEETVTIELPEVLVRKVMEEIVVPLGRTAVYRADRTDYLLLSVREHGK